MWSVPREWAGETVVILAGGPSVNQQDLSLLSGRRVIAINSAWKLYPSADVLFFADGRWWQHFRPDFAGMCVSTGVTTSPRVKRLEKVEPVAMSTDPRNLALKTSSVSGAINLALHFGAGKIVLLGVDGKQSNGRRHAHDDNYPWPLIDGCFDKHAAEFRQVAPSIPVAVINCSPVSDLDLWPRMTLEQAL